jgi:hypothetical protein
MWGVVTTKGLVSGHKLVACENCFRLSPLLKPILMHLILFFANALDLAETKIQPGKTIRFWKFYWHIWEALGSMNPSLPVTKSKANRSELQKCRKYPFFLE